MPAGSIPVAETIMEIGHETMDVGIVRMQASGFVQPDRIDRFQTVPHAADTFRIRFRNDFPGPLLVRDAATSIRVSAASANARPATL